MTGAEFEIEVRRAARALWGHPGEGAAEIEGGRERDCIFELDDILHYIECTSSRDLDKVKKDVDKLADFRKRRQKPNRPVLLWFVTATEPTPHQREYAKQHGVQILTLTEFRRKVIDGPQYVEVRAHYRFGSATDPANDSPDISAISFQPTPLRSNGQDFAVDDLARELLAGRHIALLGDFGMGKSITIRQLFRALKAALTRGDTDRVPVVLNLRDHWGQEKPGEALHRHGTLVGFDRPAQLVRALHAGRLVLLLDGFDEIAPSPWNMRATDVQRLRAVRRSAVRLVAAFNEETLGHTGVLVAGREHFFDSRDELSVALGLRTGDLILAIDEFGDNDVKSFLKSIGFGDTLPDWLPRRPLLLATLAARGLLSAVLEATGDEPAQAWDALLTRICEREAAIHRDLDPTTIRHILEQLASDARTTATGLGPVTETDIAEAFRHSVGAFPDEAARPLLQRLPGLTARDQVNGSRSFLDSQMVDVLRGGDVVDFAKNPYADPHARKWQHGVGGLGAAIIAAKYADPADADATRRIVVAASEAATRWDAPTLAMDLVHAARARVPDSAELDFRSLSVEGADCDCLDVSGNPMPVALTLSSCHIGELVLPAADASGLSLRDCYIQQVIGAGSAEALPSWISGCEIGAYDSLATNASIMDSGIPVAMRVLLTLLRKLFIQRGHGRREGALFRGLDSDARMLVPHVLRLIECEGFAFSRRKDAATIWHPNRSARARALAMIESVGRIDDPLARRIVDELGS